MRILLLLAFVFRLCLFFSWSYYQINAQFPEPATFVLKGEAKSGTTWIGQLVRSILRQACESTYSHLDCRVKTFESTDGPDRITSKSFRIIWTSDDQNTSAAGNAMPSSIDFFETDKHRIPFIPVYDHPNSFPYLGHVPKWLKSCIRTNTIKKGVCHVEDIIFDMLQKNTFAPYADVSRIRQILLRALEKHSFGHEHKKKRARRGSDSKFLKPHIVGEISKLLNHSLALSEAFLDSRNFTIKTAKEVTAKQMQEDLLMISKLERKNLKFISVLRNPVDVVRSASKFLPAKRIYGTHEPSNKERLELMQFMIAPIAAWTQFRKKWFDFIHQNLFPVHTIFYEDYLNSSIRLSKLVELTRYLGVRLPESTLLKLYDNHTKANYQRRGWKRINGVDVNVDEIESPIQIMESNSSEKISTLTMSSTREVLDHELRRKWGLHRFVSSGNKVKRNENWNFLPQWIRHRNASQSKYILGFWDCCRNKRQKKSRKYIWFKWRNGNCMSESVHLNSSSIQSSRSSKIYRMLRFNICRDRVD